MLKVRAVLQREADFEPHTLASSKCNIHDTLSGKKASVFKHLKIVIASNYYSVFPSFTAISVIAKTFLSD